MSTDDQRPQTPVAAKGADRPAGPSAPRDAVSVASVRIAVALERIADALEVLRAVAMGEREPTSEREAASRPTPRGPSAQDPFDVERILNDVGT